MRKQLKENQHKKKLQFSFIGKRNNTDASVNPSEFHQETKNIPDVNTVRERRANEKCSIKNQADLKTPVKGWLIPSEIGSGDRVVPSNINKLSADKNTQISNKMTESNSSISNSEAQKKSQDYRADKTIKSVNLETSELGQIDRENKGVVMKEITDCEDRDLKLLKLLYEGLNAKDMGANDVEPLVKTLKDIADKKIAMNMITHNITTKPVSMKLDDKTKNNNQMKCANELYSKIKEYKEKHQEKKIINSHFGSSPLNPNLINSRRDSYNTVSNKYQFSSQPKRTYADIFCVPKKNSAIISDSSLPEQSDPFEIALPNIDSTAEKNSEYAIFVRLIDKILGSISSNNTETTELLNDLNKKLLGTNKEVGSYKMLEDLAKEFGNSVAKVKGSSHKLIGKGEEPFQDLLRNAREIKNIRDRYMESRVRNSQNQAQGKSAELPALNSTAKHPNKNWSKSDELRRLQKVATELKSKIDDLLTNLEGSVADTDDDEEEDDEDDEDDDEAEEESMLRDTSNNTNNRISTGTRRNKISSEDPFESFKKFKTTDNKVDKRKFKEYEPKGRDSRLTKVVGKKPITMSNRFKSFDDKNKDSKSKSFKSKRDKREKDCAQYYDKYDIYNFKSSRRKNGDEFGRQDSNDYNPIMIDPTRMVHVSNEYPANYKNSENNFNVFKIANEFQKIHRDMIDKRMHGSLPRVSGINKYLGGSQIRGPMDIVRKKYDDDNVNKHRAIKYQRQGELNQDLGSVLYNETKRNNTDIPHWPDYNDSEVKTRNEGPNILATVKKKPKIGLGPNILFDKKINSIANQYRIRRSLMNFFDYFKSNKDKIDDKMLNKIITKEMKKNETELNVSNKEDKAVSLEAKETTESFKSVSKAQQEETTEPSQSAIKL